MKIFRVLYFGTWGYGNAGLKALARLSNVNVVQVFSKWDLQSANPYLNAVYHTAVNLDVPVVNSSRDVMPKQQFHEKILVHTNIDFIISCCFDRFFPRKIIQHSAIALNVHPSLLPAYRGVKPLENAMANGESLMGVTLHELIAELDAGDIVLQLGYPMQETSTYGYLYQKQCDLIEELILTFFDNPIACWSHRRSQASDQATDAPRLPFKIEDTDTVASVMQKSRIHPAI